MDKEMMSEFWLGQVRQNGLLLGFVPKELIAGGMCLEAVRKDSRALMSVPDRFLPDVWPEMVREGNSDFAAFFAGEKNWTPELWLETVRRNGLTLAFVPNSQITPEVCLEAVRQNGWAICSVPEEHKTLEICFEAAKQIRDASR